MELLLDTLKWSAVTGALVLALSLTRPVLEKRYSARWRYWAWLALAVLALLAPVQWEKLLPRVPAVTAPVVIDVPQMSLYVSREAGVSLQPTALPDVPSAGPERQGTRTVALGEILPAVWLGGAAAFALYHLLGITAFRRKALRWSREAPEEALTAYGAVCRDMGLKKAPPLRLSGAVSSPMLLGVLRPCLLLPGEDWSKWELAFILRHELTHYRRHDLWYKLILLAANAIHWFNPLMYLLLKEAGIDLELTCDGAVVAGMDREARRAYSETLLSAVHQEKGTALSTHFYGGGEVMKERFRNILTKRRRKWGALVLALTLLAALASACAFGLRQAEQQTPHTNGGPDQTEDPAAPPASQGHTRSFLYSGLELSVTNVGGMKQGTAINDMGETTVYTIFACYPGAQASVIKADMDDGTYFEDGLPHPNWAFDLASGGHIDITEDTGPVEISADTLGVYHKEASMYVLRFEQYDGEEPAEDGGPGLIGVEGQSVQGDNIVRYTSGGLGLAIPAAYAGQFAVNPPERPGYAPCQPENLVFSVYHRDTYLTIDPSLYCGYVMSIERYTREEFDAVKLVLLEHGYPFASDGDGLIYCVEWRSDITIPREEEQAVWEFLDSDQLQRITDDFAEYNGLSLYSPPLEPLSQAELAEFENYFNNDNLRNGLLRFPYNGFDEVKPYFRILFYDAGEPVTDADERSAAAELFEEGLETDCFKVSTDFILETFRTYFAPDRYLNRDWFASEMGPDMLALWGPYLPDYDAYYTQYGDTNMTEYTFTAGERNGDDGSVTLEYTANIYRWDGKDGYEYDIEWDQPMRVVLQPYWNSWSVRMNQRTNG